jgi:hypothetical protein
MMLIYPENVSKPGNNSIGWAVGKFLKVWWESAFPPGGGLAFGLNGPYLKKRSLH